MNRFVAALPGTVDRRVRVMGWLTLISHIAIVGTGGAVRLTGSGLGCPTWPRCTEDSFVSTPEMGIHGVIEFGNRLLTFVLIAIAIVTFLFVWRLRRERRDLFWLALIIGLDIPLQGVIGGITVWTNLNPYVVGLHFVNSALLVVVATIMLYRMYYGGGPRRLAVPGWMNALAWVTAFATAVTVAVGILTTGSGPHAGDGGAKRNGLDSELLQHLHSYPAYTLFALTIALLIVSVVRQLPRVRHYVVLLLAVELAQIAVGLWQARTGLPEILVGTHMVLSCVLIAAMTGVMMSLRVSASRVPAERAPVRVAENADVA